jgi:hypothetical protein
VLLVARNKVLLDATAVEIGTIHLFIWLLKVDGLYSISENKYPGVSTAAHSIDFAKSDEAAYEAFAATVNGKDIGVLGKPCLIPGPSLPLSFF